MVWRADGTGTAALTWPRRRARQGPGIFPEAAGVTALVWRRPGPGRWHAVQPRGVAVPLRKEILRRPISRVRAAGAISDVVVRRCLAVLTLVPSPLLRQWYNRWGTHTGEVETPMPGDDLVAGPMLGHARAISIAAPPRHVCPWLVQLGQGRGGFYSFDGLENLVGCRIHSVDTILPHHQHPEVGDLRSGPPGKGCAAWQILDLEPPHHLLLMGADPETGAAPPRVDEVPERGYAGSTWQGALHPIDGGERTRLVVRQRLIFGPKQWLR